MSDFCRLHGFLGDCPSCAGEEIIEEIPIIEDGVQVGVFHFNQGIYEDAMSLPWVYVEDVVEYAEASPSMIVAPRQVEAPAPVPAVASKAMPAARDHVSIRSFPALHAKVRRILQF